MEIELIKKELRLAKEKGIKDGIGAKVKSLESKKKEYEIMKQKALQTQCDIYGNCGPQGNPDPQGNSSVSVQNSVAKSSPNPLELLFGTALDFECVNRKGEKKSISSLIEGKSHVLL